MEKGTVKLYDLYGAWTDHDDYGRVLVLACIRKQEALKAIEDQIAYIREKMKSLEKPSLPKGQITGIFDRSAFKQTKLRPEALPSRPPGSAEHRMLRSHLENTLELFDVVVPDLLSLDRAEYVRIIKDQLKQAVKLTDRLE